MARKPKFKIGDWVLVEKKLVLVDGQKGREYVPFSLNRIGQVCGMTMKYEGRTEYISEEGCYFIFGKGHKVYLVRLGMLNKPYFVREGDMVAWDPLPKGLPGMVQHAPNAWDRPLKYYGHDKPQTPREAMREEMKEWPRDEKGRWIKG